MPAQRVPYRRCCPRSPAGPDRAVAAYHSFVLLLYQIPYTWYMKTQPTVLVVDYGAQYAQLIARRVREAKIYSEVISSATPTAEILAKKAAALIPSGGPSSVYEPNSPKTDPALFESGIPIFGICYGFQSMAEALGGKVAKTGTSEFGRTNLTISTAGRLFDTQ